MAHYAKVYLGIVTQIIVAEESFFDTYRDQAQGEWIQTSYNTYGGEHELGGTPLRKNYGALGFIYDAVRDAFYEPRPYASWTLNDTTCLWEPPTVYPTHATNKYSWNEDTTSWDIDDVYAS